MDLNVDIYEMKELFICDSFIINIFTYVSRNLLFFIFTFKNGNTEEE